MADNIFKIVRTKIAGLVRKGKKEEAAVEPLVAEPLPDAESRFTEEYKDFLGEGEETGERQAAEETVGIRPEETGTAAEISAAPEETAAAEETSAEAVPEEAPAEGVSDETPAEEAPPAPQAGARKAKLVRRPGTRRRRPGKGGRSGSPGRSGWARRGGRALRKK